MVVISAYHTSLGGQSVGRYTLGAVLAVVLEALCRPPFEPTEEISDRHLTLKTTFLLAKSFLNRVGDLQALSVAPTYLYFATGIAKAFLYPKPQGIF